MNTKTKVSMLALTTVIFWAVAFPLSKIALNYFDVNSIAILRCLIASLVLITIGCIKKVSIPKIKDVPKFFISGALGFSIYLFFFNTGVKTIPSSTSSIIIATTPVMTAIGAIFLYNEKISLKGWIAICLEFIGVLVLSLWDSGLTINQGILWTFGAAISFSGYNLYQKKLSVLGYTTFEIVTYSMIGGTILLSFLLPKSIAVIKSASLGNIGLLFILGVFSSGVAYTLWGTALSIAEKTSDVTNFMFLTPLLSVVMGFLMLREIPTMGTLIGGIIIMAGIILFQYKQKKVAVEP